MRNNVTFMEKSNMMKVKINKKIIKIIPVISIYIARKFDERF